VVTANQHHFSEYWSRRGSRNSAASYCPCLHFFPDHAVPLTPSTSPKLSSYVPLCTRRIIVPLAPRSKSSKFPSPRMPSTIQMKIRMRKKVVTILFSYSHSCFVPLLFDSQYYSGSLNSFANVPSTSSFNSSVVASLPFVHHLSSSFFPR
jgi:hypothetical protein